jgi:DNA-directed RNA polymerase subunit RPC12/RpoP
MATTIRLMKTEMVTRPSHTVALDCPWCGATVQAQPDASAIRCPECRVEVAFAPDEGSALETRQLLGQRPAA